MKKCILFIDDELDFLKLIKSAWKDLFPDWEVFIASNGIEGLSILGKHRINVVVSDMEMPYLDGLLLLKEVKEQYPRIIRIALSGYIRYRDTLESLNIAQRYFEKPYSVSSLHQAIESLYLTQSEQMKD